MTPHLLWAAITEKGKEKGAVSHPHQQICECLCAQYVDDKASNRSEVRSCAIDE